MKKMVLRLLFYGVPCVMLLAHTTEATPVLGAAIAVAFAAVGNLIVWTAERLTPLPQRKPH
jgi:hypothetical protein